MPSIGALALVAAPLLLVARADVDFDGDDLPAVCRPICRPIVELSRRCDASDLFDDDDDREDDYERNEDRLRAQCVCTNRSFDVANVASSCADCIRQNRRNNGDDDDSDDELEDINQLIRTCGFATTATFASSASTAANTISVSASAPTAASQLTTTISGVRGPAATEQGGSDDNSDDRSDNENDPGSFAARGAVPLGGFSGYSVLCSFGAFAVGAAAFLL